MRFGIRTLIAIITLVFGLGAAHAAPTRLMSVTGGVKYPSRVVADSQGNIYVSMTADNAVKIYDRKGRLMKTLGVEGPVGLAVDSSGRLYVGSDAKGRERVLVYNPDLSLSYTLGAGELGFPNSIDVGAGGRVYVVDNENHTVVVYEPAGQKAFSIGSFGSTDGLLVKPTGIAINEAEGEVYVTDQPIVQTSSGPANGARLQVFGLDGSFKRSFLFDVSAAVVVRPMDVAVDRSGMVYIADSARSVVHIVDSKTGSVIGTVSDDSRPMKVVTGVEIGKNNILYAASYSTSSIEMFGLDGYVTMETTPAALQFEARQFGPNPSSQTIVLANSGSGTVNWTAAVDQPWMTLAYTSASIGPAMSTGVTISVNINGLMPGKYTGGITITADFGQTDTIPVTLTILPPPILSLNPGWLTLATGRGKNPEPQSVTVGIENAASLSWSAISDSPWLSISPAAGSGAAAATVTVNAAGLQVGAYSGFITFSAPGALGDGSKIHVDLTVSASSKITVTTNQQAAGFSITGPTSYSGSGLAWSVEGAPAGEYTIVYSSVEGFRRPPVETKTLTEGGEIVFSGAYQSWKDLASQKNIITLPGPGPKKKAVLKTFKNDGSLASLEIIALDTYYGGSVAAGDIDGDGSAELIVGAGPGPQNQGVVRVFKADGTQLLEFMPFDAGYGVNVAAADLDGDGDYEIIAAPASGEENRSIVKVYAYNKEAKAMEAAADEFDAHGVFYGANIAAADTDGDGRPEIITAPGPGPSNPAEVKIWKVDVAGGIGSWSIHESQRLQFAGNYGLTLAVGDVDGDGGDELIIGAGPNPKAVAEVKIIRPDGTEIKRFTAFSEYRYGVNVAAADLDGDGKAEVIAAAGPDPGKASAKRMIKEQLRKKRLNKNQLKYMLKRYGLVSLEDEKTLKVYGADGKLRYAVNPYTETDYGVRVAVGDLGL